MFGPPPILQKASNRSKHWHIITPSRRDSKQVINPERDIAVSLDRTSGRVRRRECEVTAGSHPHRTAGSLRPQESNLSSVQSRPEEVDYQLKIPGVDDVMIGQENEPAGD